MNYNEEKKKGNGLLVVVIILLVILIGVGSVLIYQNYQDKNDNIQDVGTTDKTDDKIDSENSMEEKVEELSLNSTLVTVLSKVFYQKYLTTEASLYDDYFYRENKTIISTLPDELKSVMVFRYLDNPAYVTRSEFENAYKQIFGSNLLVPKVTETVFEGECISAYKYTEDIGYQRIDGCGGATCSHSESKLIGAKRIQKGNEEKIIITEAVVFIVCEDDGNKTGIYKDFYGSPYIEKGKEFIGYEVEGVNPLNGDTAQYSYTFVKDSDGTYVFTSVERVK